MRTANVLVVTVLVSIGSAGLTSVLMAPKRVPCPALPAIPDSSGALAAVERRHEMLAAEVYELRELVASMRAGGDQAEPSDSRIAEAVERALRTRELPDAGPEFDLSFVVHQLLSTALDDATRRAIWTQVRELGLIDALVAEFERRAEASAFDSRVLTDLGNAYLNKMISIPGGPEAGKWGAKGAAAFERALALDPRNWEARFELAKHSYYADLPVASLRHLEVLATQQADRVADPRHADAFLWLGNLRVSRGDDAGAQAAWRAGLAFFPESVALSDRLAEFR